MCVLQASIVERLYCQDTIQVIRLVVLGVVTSNVEAEEEEEQYGGSDKSVPKENYASE